MLPLYWQVPKKVNLFFSLLADSGQNKTRNNLDTSSESCQAPDTASVRPTRPQGETLRKQPRDRPWGAAHTSWGRWAGARALEPDPVPAPKSEPASAASPVKRGRGGGGGVWTATLLKLLDAFKVELPAQPSGICKEP